MISLVADQAVIGWLSQCKANICLSLYLSLHPRSTRHLSIYSSIHTRMYIHPVSGHTNAAFKLEFPLGYAKDDIRLKQLPRILSVHLGVYMNAGREEFRSKLFKVSCTYK